MPYISVVLFFDESANYRLVVLNCVKKLGAGMFTYTSVSSRSCLHKRKEEKCMIIIISPSLGSLSLLPYSTFCSLASILFSSVRLFLSCRFFFSSCVSKISAARASANLCLSHSASFSLSAVRVSCNQII